MIARTFLLFICVLGCANINSYCQIRIDRIDITEAAKAISIYTKDSSSQLRVGVSTIAIDASASMMYLYRNKYLYKINIFTNEVVARASVDAKLFENYDKLTFNYMTCSIHLVLGNDKLYLIYIENIDETLDYDHNIRFEELQFDLDLKMASERTIFYPKSYPFTIITSIEKNRWRAVGIVDEQLRLDQTLKLFLHGDSLHYYHDALDSLNNIEINIVSQCDTISGIGFNAMIGSKLELRF